MQKLENSWRQENGKYFYWVISAIFIFILFDAIVIFTTEIVWTTLFRKKALMFYLELLFIPMFTINFIFFVKNRFGEYCNTSFKLTVLKVSVLVTGVIISTSITEYIADIIGVIDDDYIVIGSFQMSVKTTNLVTNVFFSLVLGLPVFSKQSSEERGHMRLLEKERELSRAYELKIKSELDAIHAKINPHFLYNSLNSIVSLIHEDPHKAEKMVLSLSDLFRYSINSNGGNFSSVKKEIELVRTYLEIEQVRFQDQLTVEINVEEECQNQLIPKFLIQPIIENAIKHGTSKITNGIINLKIIKDGNDILISIFDNGPLFPEDIDSGYGLKSTVDKLDLLYKDNYSFKIMNAPKKQIIIRLTTNSIQNVR